MKILKFIWCLLAHRKLESRFHKEWTGHVVMGEKFVAERVTYHCPDCGRG